MKLKRVMGIAAAAMLLLMPLTACTKDEDQAGANAKKTAYTDKKAGFQLDKPAKGEEIAVMHTSMGDIKIRFFPEGAPKSVENFKTHAKNGYYNGLIFHRVINEFMIQGGDPKGNGSGGESIWGKSFEDEFDSKLLNLRGSLSMANSGVNTNGSQFFINQAPASKFDKKNYDLETIKAQYKQYYEQNKLAFAQQYGYKTFDEFFQAQYKPTINAEWVPDDVWDIYGKTGGNIELDGAWRKSGGHTVFGQVFEGMNIVDSIAAVKTDSNDKPETDVKINTIEIVKYEG